MRRYATSRIAAARSVAARAMLPALLLAAIALVLALAPGTAQAEEGSTGYWEYYDIEFKDPEGTEKFSWFDGNVGDSANAAGTWELTNGSMTMSFSTNQDIPVRDSYFAFAGDSVTSKVTWDGLMTQYRQGDTIKLDYRMAGTRVKRHWKDKYSEGDIDLFIDVFFSPSISIGNIVTNADGSEEFHGGKTPDIVNQDGDWSLHLTSNLQERTGTFTSEVKKGEAKNYDEMRIILEFSSNFTCTGGLHRVIYKYRWHAGEPVAATTTSAQSEDTEAETEPSEPVTIYQTVETDASDKPGKSVFDFLSEVVDGLDFEDAFPFLGMAGVAVVGAGAVILTRRKWREKEAKAKPKSNAKGRSGSRKKEEKKEPPKGYRMIVSKDFGNKLRAGGRSKEVRAHIEASEDGFVWETDPAMTAAIEVSGEDGLHAAVTATTAADKAISVSVPKGAQLKKGAKPTLSLTYRDKGGAFHNRLRFQLMEDPVIVFTNVRGERLATGECDVDALLGDSEGSVFYFGVRNFVGETNDLKIDIPSTASANGDIDIPSTVSGNVATVNVNSTPLEMTPEVVANFKGDEKSPYWCVRVTCAEKAATRYGGWPLTVNLPLSVTGDLEEFDFAKGNVTLLLWPQGLFFDTSITYELPPKRPLPSDRVWVDTSVESYYDKSRLRTTYVGIGAAYKVEGDIVEVQGFNHDPSRTKHWERLGLDAELGTPWTRFEPIGEESKKAMDYESMGSQLDDKTFARTHYDETLQRSVFDDSDPRVWYDLRMTLGVYVSSESSLLPMKPGYATRDHVAQNLCSSRRGIYSQPARASFIEIEPLIPLLVRDLETEYYGKLHVEHTRARVSVEHGVPSGHTSLVDNVGSRWGADLIVSFTGTDEGEYTKTRDELRREINRLLYVFRSHDIERTEDIFVKYGAAAERVRLGLGTHRQCVALGMTTDALLEDLAKIHSVQRLRCIRKAIFDAGVEYVHGEGEHIPWLFSGTVLEPLFKPLKAMLPEKFTGLSYAQLATFYDFNMWFWKATRWFIDIEFSAWWYRLYGKNGAYFDAFATPLKDWVLEYASEFGKWWVDEDEKWVDPRDFFLNGQQFMDKIVFKGIENTMLALAVSNIVKEDGTFAPDAGTKAIKALGYAWCFFFVLNLKRNIKKNDDSGLYELDLWEALKGTTKDCSIYILKGIVSITIARRFGKLTKNMRAAQPPTANAAKTGEPVPLLDYSKCETAQELAFAALWNKFMLKKSSIVETSKAALISAKEGLAAATANASSRWGIDIPAGMQRGGWSIVRNKSGECVVANYVPLSTLEKSEISQATQDASLQKAVDVVNEVMETCGLKPLGFLDELVKSWGTFSMPVNIPGYGEVTLKVPYIYFFTEFVDLTFKDLGIDFKLDYKGVFEKPLKCPDHPELIDRLMKMRAEKEARYLMGPVGDQLEGPSPSGGGTPAATTPLAPPRSM